jgi:hypothetical protein
LETRRAKKKWSSKSERIETPLLLDQPSLHGGVALIHQLLEPDVLTDRLDRPEKKEGQSQNRPKSIHRAKKKKD